MLVVSFVNRILCECTCLLIRLCDAKRFTTEYVEPVVLSSFKKMNLLTIYVFLNNAQKMSNNPIIQRLVSCLTNKNQFESFWWNARASSLFLIKFTPFYETNTLNPDD